MNRVIKGLVLKSTAYGDFDKLITVLTEEGKLFFKARGIRSITSKNAAGCAPFCYSEFELASSGDKFYLRRATPIVVTVRAGASINTLALASYFAELAEESALDAETGKMVLKLLMNALFILAKSDRDEALIKAVFELRFLAANGLTPLFGACSVCSKDHFSDEVPVFFRPMQGDFVCRDCLSMQDAVFFRVSRDTYELARRSVTVSEESAYAVKAPEAVIKEFAAFAEKFLLHQMEHGYKTLDFYHSIRKMDQEEKDRHETV